MITFSSTANAGLIVGGMVVVVIASAIFLIMSSLQPSVKLYLGDGVFDAEIARTPTTREKGLSGVTNLDSNKALILAYPSDGEWQIWMKDMKAPIDIIWLDSDKKVVYIVKNASPDDSINTIFTPKSSARYVVEVVAGIVDSKTIKTGRAAVFEIKTEEVR